MKGQLAESGAHVVMAVRNVKAAQELIQKCQEEWTGRGLPLNIEVMELDLLSLDSVVRFADAWNARLGPLYVLINNAGIFSIGEPQKISKDGHEEHMQVNHLAPVLLSVFLLPSLIRGSPSRTVNVNSVMHYVGFVDPEDMNVVSGKRKFTSLSGYTSSKLAQIMFSSVLQKRLPAESGINVLCVSWNCPHECSSSVELEVPIYISSGFEKFTKQGFKYITFLEARDLSKIVQAAYHLIPYFIFGPQEDCRPTNPSEEAHNVEASYKVWEKTLEMIGLPSDAVEKLIEGEEVKCKYGTQQEAALSH
ncbi:hypothetical protein Pint_07517 [Pistacia integerrima]|uniref:Uncharacterized protein n=1 Tax=Pistacia integerrima TaxID=434235 RepID=A0ACC0XRY1_9ROSI|nr:hypothetical protein Pint_07517 [Pistacia integerrima]